MGHTRPMSVGATRGSRRSLLAGAGALLVAGPRPATAAQDSVPGVPLVTPPPEPETPLAPEVLALLPNLTTRMAVGLTIDGQGPFDFVVDTGANRTTVAASVAERLALPPGPDVLVHGVTAAQTAPTVLAARLQVAGFQYPYIHMPVFPDERLGADGLLGLDVLGDFQLTFNLAQQRLRMTQSPRVLRFDADASRLRRVSEIRAQRRFGQLIFSSVRVGAVAVTAFVDSGSQYTIGNLALMRAVDQRQPGGLGPRWSVPIIGVTGQSRPGELAVVDTLHLGLARLRRTPVVFADLHAFDYLGLGDSPALLLGADMLGRLETVIVDFTRTRVTFGRVLG